MKSAEAGWWWEQDLLWLCDVQQSIRMGSGDEPLPPGDEDEPPADPPQDEPPQDTLPADSAPPAPPQQAGEKPDWRERRIAKLTAQLNEEKAKNAARAPASDPAPPQPAAAGPDFEASVQREAARLAAESEFNRQCAEVGHLGEQAFGAQEFGQRVAQLAGVVDRSDPGEVENYKTFIRAAIATGEAPKLIHMLGADPNEAARVMSLPPAQMGVELAKLSLVQPDSQSRAPRPATVPRGSGGGSSPHTAISASDPERADRLTTAEWMKRRNEEAAANAGRR